ncbi:unnamed protein product [Symbiodinium necroappetens]|uniref:JmjC domain-containing protein n=1 Tax=Symbiodinium necroappetens TaxID=1628268 RepID=A0A813C8P9_9DINO|nr:unnamed protein product [Symbiodinium necroappetens]
MVLQTLRPWRRPWKPLLLTWFASSLSASEAAEATRATLEARVATLREELRAAEAALAAAEDDGTSAAPWAAGPAVCNARMRTADLSAAAEYLEKQHALRAPFYIKAARRSFQKGLKQAQGIDKSNRDPFIKQHEGQLQLLGALDLAPGSAEIWFEAAKVAVALASLTDAEGQAQHAVDMFAHACTLDPPKLKEALAWLDKKESGKSSKITQEEQFVRKLVREQIEEWGESGSVPVRHPDFLSTLKDGICFPTREYGKMASAHPKDVAKIVDGFQVRNAFPTKILSVNVRSRLPEGFTTRLADLAVRKYEQFGKKYTDIDPNDLNDKFFSFQATHADRLSRSDEKKWPEMYRDSEDFKILTRVMKGALLGFLNKTGITLPQGDQGYGLVLWAAVYPGNGGRHGYHVHQGSASSCVLYARVAGASTPISFIDPRGAPPVNDYEQYEKERDFEPQAPFHHNEYFFPTEGDLVCFPSWLVHNVPSHWETETRVAFAANLQGDGAWDSWFHTAVGWS